jgi:hypothetical protein
MARQNCFTSSSDASNRATGMYFVSSEMPHLFRDSVICTEWYEWQRKKTRGRRSIAVPAVGDIGEEGEGDAVASVHWEVLHSTRRRWEDQGSPLLRWAAVAATAEPYSSRRVPGLDYENALGVGDKHTTGSHIKIRVRMESSPQKTIPISLQRGEDDEIRPRHAPSPPLHHRLCPPWASRRRRRSSPQRRTDTAATASCSLRPRCARLARAGLLSRSRCGPSRLLATAGQPPFLGFNAAAAEDIELN